MLEAKSINSGGDLRSNLVQGTNYAVVPRSNPGAHEARVDIDCKGNAKSKYMVHHRTNWIDIKLLAKVLLVESILLHLKFNVGEI